MAARLGLVVLLLALAMVAESTLLGETEWGLTHILAAAPSGLVGDETNPMEEDVDSESSQEGQAQRFISYDALARNNIPCSRRGASYYNCQERERANPYQRGCSIITRCARGENDY